MNLNMTLDFNKLLKGYYEAERLPEDMSKERVVPDFAFNILNFTGLLYRPVADEQLLKKTNKKPSWPDKKPFAVCLTHDVDHVSAYSVNQALRKYGNGFFMAGSANEKLKNLFLTGAGIARCFFNMSKDDPFFHYERWLDEEKKFGARSTFFFWPGWKNVTKHHPSDCSYEFHDIVIFDRQKISVAEMIREIYKRGWEIGLHPSWYSYDDPDEMKRQKEALENVVGDKIKSVRQHYLHYDIRITPCVHEKAGFEYDSTLGFNDNTGFRFGTSYPWYIFDHKKNALSLVMEIPLIIQDVAMLNPAKGMRLDFNMAFEYIAQLSGEVEKAGGVLTLLWHPDSIAKPGWFELYLKTLDYLKQKNAWLTSVENIGAWFKANNRDFLMRDL